jgi:hypothetical protein
MLAYHLLCEPSVPTPDFSTMTRFDDFGTLRVWLLVINLKTAKATLF